MSINRKYNAHVDNYNNLTNGIIYPINLMQQKNIQKRVRLHNFLNCQVI